MNNATIKMNWQNVSAGVTRAIVEASSSLFDCLDGVIRTTSNVHPTSDPYADDEHYDVEVIVAVYMPKLYDMPQDDVVKASILSDITNRIRSRIISASSSRYNCSISDGLKTTMIVDSWCTNPWGDVTVTIK